MPETTPSGRRLIEPPPLAPTEPRADAPARVPTTVAAFLDLDEATMRLIDLRIGLADAITRRRAEAGITQAALARRAGMSRPRVAEIEAHKPGLSFDTLLPIFFAVGGTTAELATLIHATDDSMSR